MLVKQHEYARKIPRCYVLARVSRDDLHHVELVGQISRESFEKNKQYENFGHEDSWGVRVFDLRSVEKWRVVCFKGA